ncbi:DedA family protein [uncultured Desulfosarcina sp.]|uniref:DedA family protein n=1 Tax=uncultured Desulfosarcina sp. TaxID=218289 RepID=UPI0029C7E188|nr:DedA family protein [uncultured Desulfosarcina sp.]
MEAFLQTYGYWAVLIGTFLEGETILVLGGLAAHLGYMNLTGVILAAFAGSLCGDQFFFFLGRHHSTFLLTRRPSLTPKLERANRLIDRFQTPLILGFRFLYGLRTVMPFAIGVSKIPVIRFLFLNAIGAIVWAGIVAIGGYLFGNALEGILGNIRRYEKMLFLLVALAGTVVWAIYLVQRRRKKAHETMDIKGREGL